MARRYFARPLPPPGPATLSPRLGHHLGRIVDTRPGTAVVLFDGNGSEVNATVIEVRRRDVVLDIGSPVAEPLGRSARMALDVVVALPKAPRTSWLLEHGTEAGIRSFRPLVTERARRQAEKHEQWQRTLIAACTQCDRAMLPTIEPTVTIDELCALTLPAQRFVATFSDIELGPATADVAMLVVGPEGGLVEHEVARLTAAGFAPRSLGPLTLRTETAVLAGATRLLQAIGGEPTTPHRQ
ncbi:MAG: 16S rRNA (uracil(1498)-N(3))-methyltransferase [Planctomycetes bacterium]|nr:16S rRNA (uracil(1498)-N(3))-methyltransferase [Planctomycetota bacterium]